MAVRGASSLIRKLSQLPASLQVGIQDALEASAAEMHGYAVQKIQRNSGGGRTYKRGGRTHTASAPGEFPNSDYGELVSKMRASKASRDGQGIIATFGAYDVKAKYLEYGTSRMAARPFMRPTFRLLKAKAQARIKLAVNTALRRYASGR
ncbi:hypothetical protein [Methylopila sp. 73B]|uniref:hypothetical protein n=1 Tax=Methylopila sp. 73B TaxID=1120792 RepID=UPI00037B9120|nr:hypothetical protein [Methylopila sp. 73B]